MVIIPQMKEKLTTQKILKEKIPQAKLELKIIDSIIYSISNFR